LDSIDFGNNAEKEEETNIIAIIFWELFMSQDREIHRRSELETNARHILNAIGRGYAE